MTNISAHDLRKAATIKDKIDGLQTELSKILGHFVGNGRTEAATSTSKKAGRRQMSAASRAKIAAAQKARWAKAKGGTSEKPAKPVMRKMGAAARAKIAAAAKARWAKAKAAGKKRL